MKPLHEKASEDFDQRAERLLSQFVELRHETTDTEEEFVPNLHPVDHLDETKIIDIASRGKVEGLTQRLLQIDVHVGDHWFSLSPCDDFKEFARALASRPELRPHVGARTVEKQLLVWCRNSIEHGIRERFTGSFLSWLEKRLADAEVWVPVANLHVESDLAFGRVVFREVTAEFMDTWAAKYREKMDAENFAAWETKTRSEYQGHSAAVCQLRVEPSSALEVAIWIAEEAVTLLRVAGGHVLLPGTHDRLHLRGREHLDSHEAWVVEDGEFAHRSGRVLPPMPEPLELTDRRIDALRKHLDGLSNLLAAQPRTEYQDTLVRSLSFYSRSALVCDPGEKLVLIMTALEILLLRNTSEAIQQAIGDRMAFVVSGELDERLKIVRAVRDCYGMRSGYVHHGKMPKDSEKLREFMSFVSKFFLQKVWAHDSFSSKEEMLTHLDQLKYSSP